MSRHLVNALDAEVQHTTGRLVAMPTPAPSFSDHGWRAIAMCGLQQMLAVRYEQVCEVKDGVVVSTNWDHKANARRLAACWNACQRIPTRLLEMSTDRGAAEVSRLMELEAQRDELLAALHLVMECAGEISTAPDGLLEMALDSDDAETRQQANAFLVARAAIAKVKGGAT